MSDKKKMIILIVLMSALIIVGLILINYPKLSEKNKEKEPVSAQVTITEKNEETKNTVNKSESLEDNKENETDNKLPIGELGVQCTYVRLDNVSDEKMETINTCFAINKNIKTIEKEHIEKIHKTIINGLATKSIVLNGKINSYTIDEIKEIVIKSKKKSIFIVKGKVNDFPYLTMYTSQTMNGDGISKSLSDKRGNVANGLDKINPNLENSINEKLNEMIEKFNDWYGSIATTYIQADGKTDIIDTMITMFEAMGKIEK